jgi:hypothetical protein
MLLANATGKLNTTKSSQLNLYTPYMCMDHSRQNTAKLKCRTLLRPMNSLAGPRNTEVIVGYLSQPQCEETNLQGPTPSPATKREMLSVHTSRPTP